MHIVLRILYCTALYCTALYCTVLYCTVLYCTVLYCTVLYCTVLYCTVPCCTVLCCTVLYCTVLYCTVLYCTVLYCAVLYCAVLCCAVLCCTVLYCTVLYCTVPYCTVLYCTVLCCAVLCCAVLCCAVLCCAVLCCAVLCCAVLYCTVLYCTVLYCTVLYCTVLYCIVLCCTVLYCTVLCCTVLCCTVESHCHCMMYCCTTRVCMLCSMAELSVHCKCNVLYFNAHVYVCVLHCTGKSLQLLVSCTLVPSSRYHVLLCNNSNVKVGTGILYHTSSCTACVCMLCSMAELSVRYTPPPSQPFSDANVADCSAGGGVLHTLTSQLIVPNTPQPYAQGAFHFTSNVFVESVTNLTLAVTNADGTVLSCALMEFLNDVGASYNSFTAISQRFPYYFANVVDNGIRQYDVLSDTSTEGCMDRSSVFSPWGGDPAVGELSRIGVVVPNEIPGVPVIGSASIIGHKVRACVLCTNICTYARTCVCVCVCVVCVCVCVCVCVQMCL